MISEGHVQRSVDGFATLRPQYDVFSKNLESLLKAIIGQSETKFHVIESRTKSIESFKEKIQRTGKKYTDPLTEVMDLCGCRIILYYNDDVSKVCDILKKEFDVIEEELSHRSEAFDADRFGYLSIHYVVKLNRRRSSLTEWKSFRGFRAEIQVRTVIQHAWSAVSHAMQYKQETSVPSKLQRRLYRIAGLFELADEEFMAIRDNKALLERAAADAIAAGEKSIPLSSSSIKGAIKNWKNRSIAEGKAIDVGFEIVDIEEHSNSGEIIGDIYNFCEKVQIESVNELLDAVDSIDLSDIDLLVECHDGYKGWKTSASFLLFFFLIMNLSNKVDIEYLYSIGWGKEIASYIVAEKNKKSK